MIGFLKTTPFELTGSKSIDLESTIVGPPVALIYINLIGFLKTTPKSQIEESGCWSSRKHPLFVILRWVLGTPPPVTPMDVYKSD